MLSHGFALSKVRSSQKAPARGKPTKNCKKKISKATIQEISQAGRAQTDKDVFEMTPNVILLQWPNVKAPFYVVADQEIN